jgi:hypothetical protein
MQLVKIWFNGNIKIALFPDKMGLIFQEAQLLI